MHLFDPSLNFMGGYAIVGGQFPIAVGLDVRMQSQDMRKRRLWFDAWRGKGVLIWIKLKGADRMEGSLRMI